MRHKIYDMAFASVYPHYVTKVEKKGRSQKELNEVISWLTGYDESGLETVLNNNISFETFFAQAPKMNPNRKLIKGVICGVRVEEIEAPLMQEIRYLDKLVDELAKGKTMEKVLRKE
ncbi:DUF2200 domain-containing protein [Staphylococcus condimenti]|uniref:DUF2200 domain-containing protein n=1 Tax=Staphylococcus condimenti TaxID=70255 RepID=A0A143PAL3_9STAP|nr:MULTISPECIES: DUF2200 domain-containing protein [Staphylococcus]AMY05565.1 hypothetical protein A4G25_06275 [Staphylococcus condimenti]APR61772.1 hypothetical protein BTZ13_11300 [Staphylococcus condimenti]MDK8645693.1 DUF2200 domain-containing protein [Staphylococcus condimenti]OFO99452.1 hypothetical protein HMPREF3007_06155 [Staphylococcus sp. HMSC065E08]PNZ62512.1 DUF2200 domain-containing protein [Staphylococcus condimenti]